MSHGDLKDFFGVKILEHHMDKYAKMSNGDYFDEKMRRGDRSKEARRISPPLKLLLKSPKLRGSTAPKSAHLHRGREQGVVAGFIGKADLNNFEHVESSGTR